MSNIAAVPVLNRKGQVTLKPAKVERYRAGKIPTGPDGKPLKLSSDDDEDISEDDNDNQDELEGDFKKTREIRHRGELSFQESTGRLLHDSNDGGLHMSRVEIDKEKLLMDPRMQRLQALGNDAASRRRTYVPKERRDYNSSCLPGDDPLKNFHRRIRMDSGVPEDLDQSEDSFEHESPVTDQQEIRSKPDKTRVNRFSVLPGHGKHGYNSDDDEIDDDESDYSHDSSSDADSKDNHDINYYETEVAPAPRLKPIFLPRSERNQDASSFDCLLATTELTTEEAIVRKGKARDLLQDEIRREKLAENNAGAMASGNQEVDDTDYPEDAEAEYALWREREFARLRRDHEERRRIEQSREEIEQRRETMTQEEREEEERKVREEVAAAVKSKPRIKFLQKYYHKGAFYHDDGEQLLQRNYNEATLEDHFNREALPEVLQRRNFGKSGQTKWTHLAKEDTFTKEAGWYADRELVKRVNKRSAGVGDLDPRSKRKHT